nr:hypothetical protein [Tanacetum cinerariifolium]
MEQELRLKREAVKRTFEAQTEKDRTLMRLEELRMTSLADKAILSGAENRPPMLQKDLYGSWKSRMEMYMLNKQHGLEENGVTRPKKYSELSATEAI